MYHSRSGPTTGSSMCSSVTIGIKRKEQPAAAIEMHDDNNNDSNAVARTVFVEPSNNCNKQRKIYRVRGKGSIAAATTTTTTSAAVTVKEEDEKEKYTKRISQILENLPASKDADEVVTYLSELANSMHSPSIIVVMNNNNADNNNSNIQSNQQQEEIATSNAKHLHDLGGHALILHCLRALTNNHHAQLAGMKALQNLTCSLFDDTSLYDSLAKAGAIKVIINAMIQFPVDYPIQKAGCGVLLNISGGSSSSLTVKQTILHEGGVSCICSAMKNHAACPKIQIRGCGMLHALKYALPVDTKDAIWKAKGVTAIVGALENHPNDVELKSGAYLALEGLFG